MRKKYILLFLAILLNCSLLHAQNVGINDDNSQPDNRAILDVKSNSKGVLLPRMTTVERNTLLQNVPNGMLILNTTTKQLQIFFDNVWYPLSTGNGESAMNATQIQDIDGNIYNTVTIGTQTWLKENLKVTHYQNGDQIPNLTDNYTWSQQTSGAYSWYNNDYSMYGTVYGALYNWYTTTDSRNVCPTGWHVSSEAELTTLLNYIDPSITNFTMEGYQGSNAGGKMKETTTNHWLTPNTGATNESGFTGLPSGYRNFNGTFYELGIGGYFWTNATSSLYLGLGYNSADIYLYSYRKLYGFPIRCIKD